MNKCVLITGACKNSGLGIAEKYCKENYTVYITGRDEDKVIQTARTLREKYGVDVYGLRLASDFNEEQIENVFAKIDGNGDKIGVLVLNAADIGLGQEFYTVPVEKFKSVFETNVFWNFIIVRSAAKRMKKYGGGSIVFVASNTAYRVVEGRMAYESSKGAVLSMSRALAFDLGKDKIRSNCVLPGMIKTDRWYDNVANQQNALSTKTPIGDIADFEDIANAVYYFGSELSKNTTGAELIVDGGNSIQLVPRIL